MVDFKPLFGNILQSLAATATHKDNLNFGIFEYFMGIHDEESTIRVNVKLISMTKGNSVANR